MQTNKRKFERKNCYFPLLDDKNTLLGKAINVSYGGLLVETNQILKESQEVGGKFTLPNSKETAEYSLKAVWSEASDNPQVNYTGLQFINLGGKTLQLLQDYLAITRVNELLKNFQKNMPASRNNLKPFSDISQINTTLKKAKTSNIPLSVCHSRQHQCISTRIDKWDINELSLRVISSPESSGVKVFGQVFIDFRIGEIGYIFESYIRAITPDYLGVTYPDIVFSEERRIEHRQNYSDKEAIGTVTLQSKRKVPFELVDWSISGLSMRFTESQHDIPQPGDILSELRIPDRNLTYPCVVVAHVSREADKENTYKLGVKIEMERQAYSQYVIDFNSSFQSKPKEPQSRDLYKLRGHCEPNVKVIYYYNRKNEKIAAILNSTIAAEERVEDLPVIIIPPALGRRKETLNYLALTLTETFRRNKKEIAVIRYDGIRSVGESDNDPDCRLAGKEMLNFRMSQSVEDILTTVDFVNKHYNITHQNIILICFSMVSIVARKAILQDREGKIKLCINVMGSTDVQDFLFNATGGIDYLSAYRQGSLGRYFQVLGCRMKQETIGDIIDNEMAYLDQARHDMSQVNVPIHWIYGKYDYWTNQRRVEDLISIKSSSTRHLYQVPTGHIVKSSNEANAVFDLITKIVWNHLYNSTVITETPDPAWASAVNAAEWNRVKRTAIDLKVYWKQYLLDTKEERIGYDVLTFSDDYSSFMEKQIDLLNLKQGDTLLDIGSGTGSFLKFYKEMPMRSLRFIILLDLVWEALYRTKVKYNTDDRVKDKPNCLPGRVGFIVADSDIIPKNFQLPIKNNQFSKILASLFISYLKNPLEALRELYRVLTPDGIVVVSSLKPDADMSKPLSQLVDKIRVMENTISGISKQALLDSTQSFINLAASLFDLEEETIFKFYSPAELSNLLKQASFQDIQLYESFGHPPQGVIAVAYKRRRGQPH